MTQNSEQENGEDGREQRVRRHNLFYRLIVFGMGLAVLSGIWAAIRMPMNELDSFRRNPPEGLTLLPEVQAGFTLIDTFYNWIPALVLFVLAVYLLWGAVLSDKRGI